MKFLRFSDVPDRPVRSDLEFGSVLGVFRRSGRTGAVGSSIRQAQERGEGRRRQEKSARVGVWDGNDPSPGSFFLSFFLSFFF